MPFRFNPFTDKLDLTETGSSPSGGILTITGDSGGAESPDGSGNFNILGSGSITVVGSTNTESIELNGLTNHNVLVGAGTTTITKIAPSATAGVPLISQGSSSDPIFGTVPVPGGGTGRTSNTAYTVICSGIGTTSALQNVSGVGNSGDVLTSSGASALPTWQPSSGGGGISTVDLDTGSITPTGGTISLVTTDPNTTFNCGSSVQLYQSGSSIGVLQVTDANLNTFIGAFAGNPALSTANTNTGIGTSCFAAIDSGASNIAVGSTLNSLTSGANNIDIGIQLGHLVSGSNNVSIGTAGGAYTGAESDNILIQNIGVLGESGVTRIGTNGTHTTCFIQGIAGVTVSSSSPVLINTSTGQLGTAVSSKRYKKRIKRLNKESENIYGLQPVQFVYKNDPSEEIQYGLIAEQVEEVFPDLVLRDREGKPQSVKYQDLPILLLNELIKLKKQINKLENKIL